MIVRRKIFRMVTSPNSKLYCSLGTIHVE